MMICEACEDAVAAFDCVFCQALKLGTAVRGGKLS